MVMNKKELVDLFLGQNEKSKYIFGTNQYGLLVARSMPQEVVFINEISKDDSFEGYSVIHNLAEVNSDSIVLNSIMSSYPITIKRKLDNAGITNIDLFSLIKYSNIPIEIEYWRGFKESYSNYRDEYDKLYELLSDEKSKDTFRRLMDVRLNLNIDSMNVFKVDEINQYYASFLNLQEEGESFVDVGGFDGNTSLQFIKRCPRYDKVYFFEPEPDIMAKAKNNLAGNENIEYCQFAASNKKEILHFSSNNSASKVTDSGEIEIHAEKIDSLVHSKVTFIKMDIEGSESLAIEGARETIMKYHPRLAICVYHKGADYVDIPRQVLAIRNDYDLYMRHYTEGVTETVMFFMPKK